MSDKSKLVAVKGYVGKDGRGRKIVIAHYTNVFGEDGGYGVYVYGENYKHGRMIGSWRFMSHELTLEQAIVDFDNRNKA